MVTISSESTAHHLSYLCHSIHRLSNVLYLLEVLYSYLEEPLLEAPL